MDGGRLDDIFKNMAVQVKHGRPRCENMNAHVIWNENMDDRTSCGTIECWTIDSFVSPESKTMMSPRCLSLRHQLLETRSRSFPSNLQNGFLRFARFARFTWFWRLTASVSTLQRLQNHEGQEILTPPLHRNVRYIVVQGPRVGWAHFPKRTGFWSE